MNIQESLAAIIDQMEKGACSERMSNALRLLKTAQFLLSRTMFDPSTTKQIGE